MATKLCAAVRSAVRRYVLIICMGNGNIVVLAELSTPRSGFSELAPNDAKVKQSTVGQRVPRRLITTTRHDRLSITGQVVDRDRQRASVTTVAGSKSHH
jgi:hypothetical protein